MGGTDMRGSVVLFAFLLILSLVPGLGSAQGWLLPSLPSLGGNGCGSCGEPGKAVTVGADIAYVGYSRSTTVNFTAQGLGLFGLLEWRHGYPVHGIQLSGMATAAPNDRVTLIARGTWLLPWNGESFENYKFADEEGDFGYLERKWTARTQWWTAEGTAAYGVNSASAVVAGVRYDSFMTNFKDPSNTNIPDFGTPNDEADLQVSLWIPYAGIVVHQGSAKFGVIGSPWLPGNVRYRQTLNFDTDRLSGSGAFSNGYFVEVWGEFSVNLTGATAGLFAKYTYVHGRAVASVDDIFQTPPNANDTVDITFDRPNWIFGAQAALSFNSPF